MSLENQVLRILIVEDNVGDLILVKEYLNQSLNNFEIQTCDTLTKAYSELSQQKFDLVLLDLSLNDSINNRYCVEKIMTVANEIPVIILTGYLDRDFTIESLHLGIQDYLIKDELSSSVLLKSIHYSIERNKIKIDLKNIHKQQKHDIADAVINAMEKSKVEVGIELHDNICQLLTGVKMFLKLYEKNNKNENLNEADELLSNTITEVRNLSHTLSAPDFTEESLEKVLLKLIENTKAGSHLNITYVWNKDDINRLPQKLALNIYRIVQEQFHNIHKHAKAKNVELQFQKTSNNLLLLIKDDGIGFDVLEKKEGIGLTNIKTRVAFFQGSAEIISAPGNGCLLKLNFVIP